MKADDGNAKKETLHVVLGSSSKFRRDILAKSLSQGFHMISATLSPNIDEKAIRRKDPNELVLAIAHAKADALVGSIQSVDPPKFLVCADQVIVFDGQIREKPESEEQCKKHLQSYGLNNVPAECVTGVVVVNLSSGRRYQGVDIAVQHFKNVPDDVAYSLIAKADIMHCAGSFVVEDPLMLPFLGERKGAIDSIQGMPVVLTNELLEKACKDLWASD